MIGIMLPLFRAPPVFMAALTEPRKPRTRFKQLSVCNSTKFIRISVAVGPACGINNRVRKFRMVAASRTCRSETLLIRPSVA